MRRDRVGLPDGSGSYREYIVHPGAVMIVPILDDGRLVVERQWRDPMGRAMLEFPAGKIEPGEPSARLARRASCSRKPAIAPPSGRMLACCTTPSPTRTKASRSSSRAAWSPGRQRRLDAGEFLDVLEADAAELDAAAQRGELTDAKTLIGLLWLQTWRAGRWPLEWQVPPKAALPIMQP